VAILPFWSSFALDNALSAAGTEAKMDKRTEERMNRLGFTGRMRKEVAAICAANGVTGLLLGNYKGGTCYPDGHCQVKNNGSLVVLLSNGKGGAVPITVYSANAADVYEKLVSRYQEPKKKAREPGAYLLSQLRGIESKLPEDHHILEKKPFDLNGIPKQAGIMYHGHDGDVHCFSIFEPPGRDRQALRVKVVTSAGIETLLRQYAYRN
jgi:hypothetical protein